MKQWKKPENTPSEVKAAGRAIRHVDRSSPAWLDALQIVDNWRAAHAFPLQVFYVNLRRLTNGSKAFVAQRLKRLASIVPKLQSNTVLNLWAMQDLGGCRVIVPNLDQVYFYEKKLRCSRIRHELLKVNDYIASPKGSGYRSLHVVYRYHSDKHVAYNKNMLIEIQFRTRLQHVWATAVETMGLYTGLRLKSGEGDKAVKRFFALTSSLFALRENCCTVPLTPMSRKELVQEIVALNEQYSFLEKLSAMVVAVDIKKQELSNSGGYYLLSLDLKNRLLRIRPFRASEYDRANELCTRLENGEKLLSESRDVVLVRVQSMKELRRSYPNYFSDVKGFVKLVQEEISTMYGGK